MKCLLVIICCVIVMRCFYFSSFLAFGVAHQAVEEVSPSGDTILVQGYYYICKLYLIKHTDY